MKQILAPTAVLLSLFLGLGLAQDPPPDESLTQRVAALEEEVAALRKEVDAGKALAEETTRYLAGAKQRSDALLGTFDEAEKLGFTAGINFTSREVLLAGLRAYVRDEAAGLPGAKKAEPKPAGR
jgi:hypothetical protein